MKAFASANSETPNLLISSENNIISLSWDDSEFFELQTSNFLEYWNNASVVTSPYTVNPVGLNKYFRLFKQVDDGYRDGLEWVEIQTTLASEEGESTDFSHQWTWSRLPQLHFKRATIINDSDSTFLIRKSNPNTEIKAKYYAGEWNGNIASTEEKWKNLAGNLPQPIASTMGFRWCNGVYWRITGDTTINGIEYASGGLLVYRALLAHTSTRISDPSVQLGWEVLPAGSLAWRGVYDPINETTPMALTYNGEVLEIISDANGYKEGTLWVNGNDNISTNDIFVLSPGESMEISNSPSEHEYRLKDGSISETKTLSAHYTLGFDINYYQDDGTAKVYSERLGIIDDLSEINSYNNWDISLSDDGNYLFFNSDRESICNRYIIDLDTELVSPQNNRNITLWGDSIANHYANTVNAEIRAWDISEGRSIRNVYNHGKGSYNAKQITNAMKYFKDANPELLSRIALIVFDWGNLYDQDLRELMQQLSMLTGMKRYILSGHYSYQRELVFDGNALTAKARSQAESDFVYKLKNTFGSALNGTGTYADYFEMLTETPEALVELNKYDPQFPYAENQLEVIQEYNCLPFYSAKSTVSNLPTANPELFRGKFKGYLSDGDPEPTTGENYDYYLATDETDWFGVGGRVGNMIWNNNGTWIIMSLGDLHPGPVATSTIGKIYRRIFEEKNWK
ncbi:MAG: hypothetical protein P8I61_05220 [Opitutae bacterium]|nr:hypothetical protein [Opitutae bacterium]